MSAVIDSERSRVWRALTDPREVLAWDDRMLAAIDEPPSLPITDFAVRWRYRLGPVQTVMRECARSVIPLERLSSSREVGSMRFEQSFHLTAEASHSPRTRLGMKVVSESVVPVLGDVVDRFEVRRMAVAHVDETLRSVQKWCENHP